MVSSQIVNDKKILPVGAYTIRVKDILVEAFWPISLYNKDGYFEKNGHNSCSVNNLSGIPNEDGSLIIRLGGDPTVVNYLPITESWN